MSTTIDTSISGSLSSMMFTSNIISQNDSNSDNQLTIDELEVDEDTFSSIDTDSDGYATKNEIASAINEKLAEYDEMPTLEEFSLILENLGIDVSLTSSSTSKISSDIISLYDTDGDSSLSSDETSLSDEEFSTLDTNEDGVLTADELVEGVDSVLSEEEIEEEEETTPLSAEEIKVYTLQMLFEALDMATDDSDDDIALSNLDQFMKLYNEENDDLINTYISNLTDSDSSTISYA